MEIRDCDLYMVGSMAVPSDTTEEAMRIAADGLGDRLFSLPDGEVGQRSVWVAGLGAMTFYDHPAVEQPGEAAGFHPLPGPFGPLGSCRVRPGTDTVSLTGHLPYAGAALDSYQQFSALKASGAVRTDMRFQVAVPTPMAAIAPFFADPGDWPRMEAAWQEAITAEIVRIVDAIPARELSIQWDYCMELCDIVSAASGRRELTKSVIRWNPELSVEEAFGTRTGPDYIRPMADGIGDEVAFGYHLCLGTFPAPPTTPVDDLEWTVKIANALVANTPRRVDFVHLPSMPDSGREFFAPLADLDVGDARVFLGVGNRDGVDAIVSRGRAAREFLPDFGISHYCGYGRDDRSQIHELLADLKAAADQLGSAG